jgi:chemotaxis protein histidine kinase CheA
MKRKLAVILGLMLVCTGCGSSKDSYQSEDNQEYSYSEDYMETAGLSVSDSYYDYDEYEASYDAEETAEVDNSVSSSQSESAASTSTSTSKALNKEMLVYRGSLSVDTLDFDTSVSSFKNLINEKNGFVESESYSDNQSTGGYYSIDAAEKHNTYTATVRVPSSEYDNVMNSAGSLGDVRSRLSNASNVTQQYSTYTSQLEIYETEYNRYLNLLEAATDDEYAFQIENELFDIQIQIANLKSGITNIENDVAYSYIDITIKEVTKYEEKPVETDTFADRFKNVCKNSWSCFMDALEELLFFLIMNIYYIIIILAVIIIVGRIIKNKISKKDLGTPKTIEVSEHMEDK